jgi:coiled-coil domain-containing protein 61
MLVSALTGTSDSVHIDILTHHDLEVQALRKSGTSNKITDPKFINKRYIIMSYMAEFDKVHYPLPL